MTKDEMKNRISMALKDPILQQGFEIICKENEELKKDYEETEELLDKQIEETYKLFKENVELKKKLKEELKTIADKDLSFVARFDALEKENVDLKEDNKVLKETISKGSSCGDWNDNVHACQMYLRQDELQECIYQLSKAKEIIKKYYTYNPSCEYSYEDIDKEAEQFLKEE